MEVNETSCSSLSVNKLMHLENCNDDLERNWKGFEHVDRFSPIGFLPADTTQQWNEPKNVELYNTIYWPKLKHCVLTLLNNNGQKQNTSISCEEYYRCVYQSMCSRHTEVLYRDLIDLVTGHVKQVSKDLSAISKDNDNLREICKYITQFYVALKLYGRSLQGIVPIFSYLNRVYVTSNFDSSLEDQLLGLFKSNVVTVHARSIINAMKHAKEVPFSVDPSIMSELAKALYSMMKDLQVQEADFFSCYIPNVAPLSCPEDLEKEIQNTKQLQFQLQGHSGFRRSSSGKRSNEEVQAEDEQCSNTLLSSILSGFRT